MAVGSPFLLPSNQPLLSFFLIFFLFGLVTPLRKLNSNIEYKIGSLFCATFLLDFWKLNCAEKSTAVFVSEGENLEIRSNKSNKRTALIKEFAWKKKQKKQKKIGIEPEHFAKPDKIKNMEDINWGLS